MEGNQKIVPANFVAKTPENNAQRVMKRRRPYIPGRDNLASKPYPPGYRFVPKDEELIVDYLMKRIDNEPIPVTEMCDVNLYLDNPQALADIYPQLGENEWYYFTPRDRKYKNGLRPSRSAGTGYWKATGSDRPINFEAKVVGFKKSLVFYEGKPPQGNKTNWIMHEYRVDKPPRDRTDDFDMRLDDFVLCRVYKKSERVENQAKKKKNAANPRPANNPVRLPDKNPVNPAAPLRVVAPLQVADEKQEQEQEHERVAVDFRGNNVVFSDNTPVVEKEDDVDTNEFLHWNFSEFEKRMPECRSGQYQQEQQHQPIWQHSQSQPPFQHQQPYHPEDSFRSLGGELSSMILNNGNWSMHDYRNFPPSYYMPNDHPASNSFDVQNQRRLGMHAQNLDGRNPRNFAAELLYIRGQSHGNIQHAHSRDHTFVPRSDNVVPLSSILVPVPPVDDSSVKADDSFNPDYNSSKRTRY